MKVRTYEEARTYIEDGDIVFVCKGKTLWSRLTQLVTRSDVFHCGIAFWVRDPRYKSRLFIVEAHRGGRRIVSLSSYKDHPMYILKAPVSWGPNSDTLLDNTGVIPYSIIEYVWIGLLELFNIRRKKDDLGEVCSKMVAKYLVNSGVLLETDISPGLLKDTLLEMQYEIRLNIVQD